MVRILRFVWIVNNDHLSALEEGVVIVDDCGVNKGSIPYLHSTSTVVYMPPSCVLQIGKLSNPVKKFLTSYRTAHR